LTSRRRRSSSTNGASAAPPAAQINLDAIEPIEAGAAPWGLYVLRLARRPGHADADERVNPSDVAARGDRDSGAAIQLIAPDGEPIRPGRSVIDGASYDALMPDATILTSELTKRYGETLALSDLSLEVSPGEIFGFLGPNGAGKTTTIRLLMGLLQPTAGRASLLGMDPWRDAAELHRRLGYLSSDFVVWPHLTGEENLELLGNLHGGADAGLRVELIDRFELDPSKRGRAYSRGNVQKLGLIAAFQSRGELMILDEPTTGLDPLMAHAFRKLAIRVRDEGRTVFLSSHVLSEVEAICDRVGILRSGRLVEVGTLEDLRHLSARVVEIRFGGDVPSLGGVDGVTVQAVEDHLVRCEVRGAMTPLIEALRGADVTTMDAREASLEELFLRYYGEEGP
jgi:ABC-2 type transport system ATP-binding protein